MGLEKDVPFAETIFPFHLIIHLQPLAPTSGFILLSKLGPIELKLAITLVAFTALQLLLKPHRGWQYED
jgi:hypothetical protein